MRNYILLLFLLLNLGVFAQNVPDNDHIQRLTSDVKSPFYYPHLFARYQRGDSTLTKLDYHYLYYGYAFQPNYRPLEYNRAADDVLINLDDESLSLEQRDANLMKFIKQSFDFDPFSPTTLNILTYLYGLELDTLNENINALRLKRVVETITSSGTGIKEKSPWHVLYFDHARDVMVVLGKDTRPRMVVSRTTEYFPLTQKEGKVKGYYFDFSRAYLKEPEQQDKKRANGFEINGTKIHN